MSERSYMDQYAEIAKQAEHAEAENSLTPSRYPLRLGVRIAVDVGKVRVGIAKTDDAGILPTPVTTAQRGKNDISIVLRLVRELKPLEIYVGYPLQMDGTEGASAKAALRWAAKIAKKVDPIPVRMIDERLTSIMAHRQLHEAGRKEITHRSVVDQLAAINILESALDNEKITGKAPGIDIAQLSPRSI